MKIFTFNFCTSLAKGLLLLSVPHFVWHYSGTAENFLIAKNPSVIWKIELYKLNSHWWSLVAVQMWPLKLSTSYKVINFNILKLIWKLMEMWVWIFIWHLWTQKYFSNSQGSWTCFRNTSLYRYLTYCCYLTFSTASFPYCEIAWQIYYKGVKFGTKNPVYHSLISWLQLFISLSYTKSISCPL